MSAGWLSRRVHLVCSFNTTRVAAIYVSSTLVICQSPPIGHEGYSVLELSANGYDYTTDGVLYKYEIIKLTTLRPRHGPILGGTLLTVGGINLPLVRIAHHQVQVRNSCWACVQF